MRGKAEQRNIGRQTLADETDRLEYETEFVDIGQRANATEIVERANRVMDGGTVARRVLQVESHRLQDRKQVGEKDRRINSEHPLGGERHLGGQIRAFAQFKKRNAIPHDPVFGQIATGLPHNPNRRGVRRFAAGRAA